ncbi:chorismate dehydratase [Candidatus Hakubella thermalkaliphila]|uniref:Chorismate dehydratase n=2 Tax=Candidatus Hakubella thermalkaliphila TaxID=2754717 RepID=A0A6V8P371_9ACTN|nr:menaquinone biosynthesis protein [Candidatus Hakubella thermalkaliphila]GFP27019.1 chorismate dehydratase [Candidatus Hakubella thermalkaliphila]GFP34695.1 chorismate dehydratase [Candidatus Hakubella thermalkaliphila]
MRPRIGHIQFLNCLPLYYGLVTQNVLLDIELVKGTPTELNQFLIRGELDIGPLSSIEYCFHQDKFLLLPDLAVSSDGRVQSILMVSKRPARELDGQSVSLANTSATSQILLKIILAQKYGVQPTYVVSPPDLPRMLMESEAALLIGDVALRALYHPQDLLIYDLGEEWKGLTGYPMTYAVWVVRREFAIEKAHLASEVHRSFLKSMTYSQENLEQIAHDAARWEIFSEDFLKDYFSNLEFSFDERYQKGLMLFYEKAKSLGYIAQIPQLEFFST